MAITVGTLAIKDGGGTSRNFKTLNDSADTSVNPMHAFMDDTGAQILPVPKIIKLTAAPTVTAGAYTTGQVVGGLNSLASATRINAGSGAILGVQVTVKTALTAPYDVFFFDTNPTNSTFTDNSAVAVNVADLPSSGLIAHCTDLVSCGTPQILQASGLYLPFALSAAAKTLYAAIVIRGAQTFASTTAIGLNVYVQQN